MKTLYDHQEKSIQMLRQSLARGKKRPMLMAPTGCGKTVMASAIVKMARGKGNKVCFTVPALSLIDQTVASFGSDGIDSIGVIQADHPLTNDLARVQVASVQTLERRPFPDTDLVIVDEAHLAHKVIFRWMEQCPDLPFIGLSATPWTKGLGKHYDDLIIGATTAELIEKGFLSKFRVFAPSHPDLKGVKTVAGDYHEGQLAEAMDKPTLTADIVSTWMENGENRPTLCFAVNRAHAKALQDQFRRAGVRTEYIDAYTERDERSRIGNELRSGRIKVVCNVGTLTTGVDWDVRCIILARPTKSEALYTQIIGRGLRTADGKDDCVLRGTPILTDKGEVNIEHVTLDHKVWDGVEFVAHAGAICKGVQPVISHDGITATPDHRVMTNEGWMSLQEARRRGARIARTGLGGQPIRFIDDSFTESRRGKLQPSRGSEMRAVPENSYGSLPQHQEAPEDKRLPSLQWAEAGHGAAMAIPEVSSSAGSMLQSVIEFLRTVWRARDRVSVLWTERGSGVGYREPWVGGSVYGTGPRGQRRPLPTWKSPMGSSCGEHEQHASVRRPREIPEFQEAEPKREVCGRDANPVDCGGEVRSGNHRSLEQAFVQAEGEVWDVLNAGPLQRFTANGRLVHNCVILDHSDTTLRLGFVTDILHEDLDKGRENQSSSGQRERSTPLPKECPGPECTYIKPAGVHKCPACGFAPEKMEDIEAQDGELAQLKGGKKQFDRATKQLWWSGLLWYCEMHNRKQGWAAHKYREKFGVWPRGLDDIPSEPTAEIRNYVKAAQIRYAKGRAKAERKGVAAHA